MIEFRATGPRKFDETGTAVGGVSRDLDEPGPLESLNLPGDRRLVQPELGAERRRLRLLVGRDGLQRNESAGQSTAFSALDVLHGGHEGGHHLFDVVARRSHKKQRRLFACIMQVYLVVYPSEAIAMRTIFALLAVSIGFVAVAAEPPAVGQTPSAESFPSRLPATRSRLGLGWAFLYGYQGAPAEEFMSEVRKAGGGFGKVYLFWNQIEPEQGHYDWTAVDEFVRQLDSPEEGLVAVFSSSEWASAKPSAMLPPGPAKNLDDYYRFVFDLVSHCKGRVRYWQNDCEPNNPVFWSGTKEQFVAQLKTFYKAVKAADPDALVVAGGYDGLFNPPGMLPMFNQAAGLEFFDYVLKEGRDAFDVFDLRLYADPYTIPGRVDVIRGKMQRLGYEKPIVATEYGGPGFFEFPVNLLYVPLVIVWSQAAAGGEAKSDPAESPIGKLYERMETLAPETQMFMQGCPAALDAKLYRLQCREVAVRNVLALSAGVERTAYWELLTLTMPRDNMMMLMYGKVGMLSYENHKVAKRFPVVDAFARTARALDGVRAVKRIELPSQKSLYYFEIDRGERGPAWVIWDRRNTFSGEDSPAIPVELSWSRGAADAADVLGNAVTVEVRDRQLKLPVSVTPIFIEPRLPDDALRNQTSPK